MFALLALALLTIPDTAGDAHGDGSYVLPSLPPLSAAALDLRDLRVEAVDGKLQLQVGLGAVQNPWNAPLGESAGVVDIFIKSRLGGATELAGLGFSTPPGQGWQYHLHLSPFSSSIQFVPDGQTRPQTRPVPLAVRLTGSTLVVGTPIPAGQYSYWVTMSVYSPFTPDGYLRPTTSGGASSLRAARLNSPLPVDVIAGGDRRAAYASGVLTPVGQTRDRRALLLLAVGLAALVVVAVATLVGWRRR